MKFSLEIESENDAMATRTHIIDALLRTIIKLQDGKDDGRIRDINGNTVGSWGFD